MITYQQRQLLRRVEQATSDGSSYFTEEQESEDMAELLELNLVEGDVTEVEINEFGMLELYGPKTGGR